jgi:hypothetical protein
MANLGQKNFSVNINENLSDLFTTQIAERGFTKYRALEGAIRLWLSIPPDEQVKLMVMEGIELIPEDDKELYGPNEFWLSPGKKSFRREVLKILKEAGVRLRKPPPAKSGRKSAKPSKSQ